VCEVARFLQVVGVGDVPLHGVVDGVVALEEILARLLLVGAGIGVHVLIQKLPHVVGEVQDLEVLGVLESSLELLGNSTVEGGLLHDLADQPLLAVQVVVVELLVDLTEHGDPGHDVEVIEESVVGRPILLCVIVLTISILLLVVVSVVRGEGGSQAGAAGQGNGGQSTDKDKGAQKDKGGATVGGIEIEESGSRVLLVNLVLLSVARANHGQQYAC